MTDDVNSASRLRREVGPFGAVMLGLGAMIGTGVFVSLGLGAGLAGPAVIVALVLAAGVALCNGLSSAQLAAAHPGIAVEADTAVTGNVVEGAPTAGIILGSGRYLRDVAATGNVVRKADIGIAVSVAAGAGTALIANNVIADVLRGAIVGLDGRRIVTGDLAKGGGERYANLSISGNRVR